MIRQSLGTYSIQDFGASPTKTAAQNDLAIQAAINAAGAKGGGTIVIPDGTYQYNEVTITQPWIKITGSGTLLNGHILVGPGTVPTDLHFEIEKIKLKYDAIVVGKHGIELQNARMGQIHNVIFQNCDCGIYVRPIDSMTFQQCQKIEMTNNHFKEVNYCLYVDRPAYGQAAPWQGTPPTDLTVPKQLYQVGDFDFSHNYAYVAHKAHIYCLGIDGLVCHGNTFFFPGWNLADQVKTHNIYIDMGNFISIVGNQLFEAGLEGIKLSHCRNFTIAGNAIPWCGQRDIRSAILITGGDQNGQPFNVGTISANCIEHPRWHGISIEDSVEGQCGQINISGNTIRDAGNSYGYYGVALLTSVSHYAVNVTTASQFVAVHGNVAQDDAINVLGDNNVAYDNLTQGRLIMNTDYALVLAGTETTAAVGKYDRVNLNQSAPATITTFTGGYDGKTLDIFGVNGNTTLAYGTGASQFVLKGGPANTTIPANGYMQFKFLLSHWIEVSRNF